MTDEPKLREASEAKSPRDTEALVVFAVFGATALTAFAIQAWMTFGFGHEVWGMSPGLAASLVVALDLFAIMFMVLSYLLRGTGWPRFVAFVIFAGAISAQVYAAEMFGDHKRWTTEIRAFAALPALLLAASQEGVILWRSHRNDRVKTVVEHKGKRDQVAEPPARPVKVPSTVGVEPAPKVQRPSRPVAAPDSPPVIGAKSGPATRGRRTDPAEQERRDAYARQVIDIGGDKAAKEKVAGLAGVSTRAVENWLASYRERHPGRPETDGKTQVSEEVSTDGTQES